MDSEAWDSDTYDNFRLLYVPQKAERRELHGKIAAMPGASWRPIGTVRDDGLPPKWKSEADAYLCQDGTKVVDGCQVNTVTYKWQVPNLPQTPPVDDEDLSMGLPSSSLDERDEGNDDSDSQFLANNNNEDELWEEYENELYNWMADNDSYKESIKDEMDKMEPSWAPNHVKQARLWVLFNTDSLFGSNFKSIAAKLLTDFETNILAPYGWHRVPPNIVYEVKLLNNAAKEWLRMKQKCKFQYLG